LYLTVRDKQKGLDVVQDILTDSTDSHAKLELLHLELDSVQSVQECAKEFLRRSKVLNVLINNAGRESTNIDHMHINACAGSIA